MKPDVKVIAVEMPKGAKMGDGCPVECRYCSHHHYLNFLSPDVIPEEVRGDIPMGVCVRGYVSSDKEAGTVTLRMVTPKDACWEFHGKHWDRDDIGFRISPRALEPEVGDD